ncbi:MAG: coenzyme F420-0:L-glutamate ligase [Gammaproteobacteria bacterium]|nr:coenzyme F420-0:L-glutamate ligase [Gammaproteobacteria bacterium]
MNARPNLQLWGLPGIPHVRAGDDLAALLLEALQRTGLALLSGDVVVVAQKIVSKSEGRLVDLAGITPSARACELAPIVQKDARLVELVLREARRIVRMAKDVLIVEHRLGFVMANAGIDQSNVADTAAGDYALLLPQDPDASARTLRAALRAACGVDVGVIVSDSFGRPWRIGTVGVALGAAGLPAVLDLRGQPDLFGRTLRVTVVGHADEIAAAASLVMGQAAEGCPMVLVRGLAGGADIAATQLLRPPGEDLFR